MLTVIGCLGVVFCLAVIAGLLLERNAYLEAKRFAKEWQRFSPVGPTIKQPRASGLDSAAISRMLVQVQTGKKDPYFLN